VLQRKIGRATHKLEKIQQEREELRQEFAAKDEALLGREEEWEAKLSDMRAQFGQCCSEHAAMHEGSGAKGNASAAYKEAKEAGELVEELLSAVENEEVRNTLLQISRRLEKINVAAGRRGQGGTVHEGEEGESEGEEEAGGKEGGVATPVAPPAKWMRRNQGNAEGGEKEKAGAQGKGQCESKKKGKGNVAEKILQAQEQIGRRPTHEEEVEMARRVVAVADDKYKGQQLSDEDKRGILAEACREMSRWIFRHSPMLHEGSTGEECAEGMETMARCKARVEEAAAVLAARRQEDAQAAALAAGTGRQAAITGA
jgi:hypothetical protein